MSLSSEAGGSASPDVVCWSGLRVDGVWWSTRPEGALSPEKDVFSAKNVPLSPKKDVCSAKNVPLSPKKDVFSAKKRPFLGEERLQDE